MELLIPMINQLQHIFTAVNAKLTLTLPQIAVVGAQSAGKSSVLENIVGRYDEKEKTLFCFFFTLKNNFVCSETFFLVVEIWWQNDLWFFNWSRLKAEVKKEKNDEEKKRFSFSRLEYAVFGHKPQHRFTNYADVRAEIENDTKVVVRDDMGVSNIPINLTIYSPHGKKGTGREIFE